MTCGALSGSTTETGGQSGGDHNQHDYTSPHHFPCEEQWRPARDKDGVLVSRVPGPVIGSKGLASDNTMLEGATSEIGVVLEGHGDGGDDDEDSSWTTNFFYLPRSRTIPKVV